MDGFADVERPLPGGHFREQFRPVLRRHDERIGRVFHFAQIDDSVRAVEREVDLSARLAVRPLRNPRGIDVGRDARNAEGRLDLRNVVEAELLVGGEAQPVDGLCRAFPFPEKTPDFFCKSTEK